ncbi:ketohexokinase-like [Antedon mediterranea]|uniref:ketohexokinase-like n=1 Tax=Antedon mediterranea TaxID=105859 RepID=UPI003AF770DE
MAAEKRMLFVGLSCLDIINVHDHYPEEDTDSRSTEQFFNRGGNASNTAVVASQLGGCAEYIGTIASHILSEIIKEDLNKHQVKFENCSFHDDYRPPTSCVILNSTNGLRTILHANNSLPELSVADFSKINLAQYSWIHFEGRNIPNVLKMIELVENYNSMNDDDIKVSVELEKSKTSDIEKLLSLGHVVFVSKEYVMNRGYTTSESALHGLHDGLRKGAVLICAWGSSGAWGRGVDGTIYHAPAYKPEKVVDTLGAGDTFNAGVIWALNRGRVLSDALNVGCKIAGRKCGMYGLSGIEENE